MKTLDEVIAELEDEGLFADALHYLKTYRENQHAYEEGNRKAEEARERYLEAVKNCERAENLYKQKQKAAEDALWKIASEPNPALTWDELKQMFHRPVWIETTAKKGWNIIVSIDSADMQVIHTAHRGPKLSGFSKADLGKTWQAYRKERK